MNKTIITILQHDDDCRYGSLGNSFQMIEHDTVSRTNSFLITGRPKEKQPITQQE